LEGGLVDITKEAMAEDCGCPCFFDTKFPAASKEEKALNPWF
jgi:hypothetical protein